MQPPCQPPSVPYERRLELHRRVRHLLVGWPLGGDRQYRRSPSTRHSTARRGRDDLILDHESSNLRSFGGRACGGSDNTFDHGVPNSNHRHLRQGGAPSRRLIVALHCQKRGSIGRWQMRASAPGRGLALGG